MSPTFLSHIVAYLEDTDDETERPRDRPRTGDFSTDAAFFGEPFAPGDTERDGERFLAGDPDETLPERDRGLKMTSETKY